MPGTTYRFCIVPATRAVRFESELEPRPQNENPVSLKVLFKMSDHHPCHFYREVLPIKLQLIVSSLPFSYTVLSL